MPLQCALKSTLKILLAGFVLVMLSACNSSNMRQANDPWWYAFVSNTHDHVDVLQVRRSYLPSGDIALAVTLKNNASFKETVKYKVEWFNADAMPINTILSRWNTVSLLDKETHTISAISPGSKAVDFYLTIR